MAELGTGYISIVAQTGGMQRDIQKAFSGLGSTASKAGEGLGSKLSSGISKTLKVGAAATGAAVAGTLGASIAKGFGRLQAFDQAEAKFRGLGKSAEEITTIMDGVNDAVTGTVFGLDEAAGSAAKLSGVGVEAGEEMNRMMTLTADIAAQAGRGMGEMDSVMAKILGSGKLTGETLAQLDDAATGASGAIADHLNVSIEEMRDMVSKGEVDVETFATAMEGHLGGAAQAGGETFSGAMSMVGSALGRLGATLIGPLFEAAPKVFGSLTDAVNNLHERVTPLAEAFGEWLAPRVADFAENLGPRLESAIEGIATVIGNVVGFVRDNSDWLGTLAAAVSGAAAAWAAWTGAIKLWQKVTKIATGVQTAFNAVMSANPIMLVVMAIAALVAGLVYFFTQTEMGKELWASFTEFLGNAWDWVVEKFSSGVEWVQEKWTQFSTAIVEFWESYIRPVFDAISQVVQTVLGVVFAAVVGAALAAWNVFSSGIQWAWENVIRPVWDGLVGFVQGVLWPALQSVFGFIKTAWDAVAQGIQWAWQNIILVAWNALQAALQFLWNAVVQPIFNFIRSAWDALASGIMSAWNGIIRPAWDALSGALQSLWSSVISPVLQWAGDKWQWFSDKIGEVIAWVRDVAFARFRDGLQSLRDFIGSIVDGIRDVWNRLRGHLAKPINFMINTVYNDGILRAWNVIAGILPGLKEGSPLSGIPEYAVGGRINGPGTGTSDDVLMWGSNGEHMWTASEVIKAGGHAHVYRMREAVEKGHPFISDGKGGVLTLPKTRTDDVGDLAGAAPGLFPRYRDGGEIRPLWEAQLMAGHRYAIENSPRPYIFGGSTSVHGGTDCSGWMGEIADAITGGPYGVRSWATGNFPGRQAGMWAPGLGKGFSIGYYNGGPGGGHTAGTLSGVGGYAATNVESGGGTGQGNTYGGRAVGADHSQFNRGARHHLKIGADGAFESGGGGGISPERMQNFISEKLGGAIDTIMSPLVSLLPEKPPEWKGIPRGVYDKGRDGLVDFVADAVGNLGDKLATVFSAANGMGDLVRDAATGAWDWVQANLFDRGGVWKSGTVGVNLSGADEYVFTNRSMRSFENATEMLAIAAEEIRVAYEGGDWGYGALADILGREDWALAIVDAAATVGEIHRDIEKAANPYTLEGIAARSAASHGGEIAGMLGMKNTSTVINAVIDAEATLLEAREGHAERTAKITAAEKALIDARDNLTTTKEAEYEDDAKRQEAVAKATDDVAKAEADLADARRASAKALDMSVFEVAPQIFHGLTGAAAEVSGLAVQASAMGGAAAQAAPMLGQVAGALTGAAAVAGPAGISVGVAVAGIKAAIELFKTLVGVINGIVLGVLDKSRAVRNGMTSMFGSMRELAEMQAEAAEDVVKARLAYAMSLIELQSAYRDVRIAAADGAIAQANAVVSLAEAQAEFEKQRRADMAAALADYTDLSLTFDRFRWNVIDGIAKAVDGMAAWSDESRALWSQVQAAQVGLAIAELTSKRDQLQATWDLGKAAIGVAEATNALVTAQMKLANIGDSGQDQVALMLWERESELLAQIMQAERNRHEKWWSISTRIESERLQKALWAEVDQIRSHKDYVDVDDEYQRQFNDLHSRAWAMNSAAVDMAVENILGDASRKLDRMVLNNQIIDVQSQASQLRTEVYGSQMELDYSARIADMDAEIKALEYRQEGFNTQAEAWRASNAQVRAAYRGLATAQFEAAEAPTVKLYGSTASMDDVEAALESLGIRVERLERPRPSARDVTMARRG